MFCVISAVQPSLHCALVMALVLITNVVISVV